MGHGELEVVKGAKTADKVRSRARARRTTDL